MIKHEGGQFVLYSHDGSKVLGKHPSKKKALEQERAIQISKHSKSASFYVLNKVASFSGKSVEDMSGPDFEEFMALSEGDRPGVSGYLGRTAAGGALGGLAGLGLDALSGGKARMAAPVLAGLGSAVGFGTGMGKDEDIDYSLSVQKAVARNPELYDKLYEQSLLNRDYMVEPVAQKQLIEATPMILSAILSSSSGQAEPEQSPYVRCEYCGTLNPKYNTHCTACGAPL